jgi:hypothetical protein
MRAVEDIIMAVGLWKSEMEVRGRLVDEKTDFLVETIRGMCEILEPYPLPAGEFKSTVTQSGTMLCKFLGIVEKRIWEIRSKMTLIKNFVEMSQSFKRLLNIASIIRSVKFYLESYYDANNEVKIQKNTAKPIMMSAKELEEELNKALQTRALKSNKKRSSSRRDLIPLLNTKEKDKDNKDKDKEKDKEGSLTSRRGSKVIIKDEKKDKVEDGKDELRKSGSSKLFRTKSSGSGLLYKQPSFDSPRLSMREEDVKKERRKSQGRKKEGTLSTPSSVKFDSVLDSSDGPSSLKSSSGDLKD